jgi:protein TonB
VSAARAPRRLRLSAEARHMLPWCIALSAAAHVLLLAAVVPAGPRPGGLPHAASRAARPISVRLITEAPAAGIAASSAASAAPPASEAGGTPQGPAVMATKPASAPVQAFASEPAAAPTRETDSSAAAGPDDAVDGGYVPRPLLSIAPQPEAPVVIATPPDMVDMSRRVGVLALYIDEQGRVRRIDAEQPLPPAMERAAREAFMAARFSPGQVDGHVVRSRIRVEVVFDSRPLPAASAAHPAPAASAARAASGQRSP